MRALCASAVAFGLATIAPVVPSQDRTEFRGAWASRFEWTSRDPERCKANIEQIFAALAEANFNAAVFQIRGAAETLYPSDLEPWSPLLGGKDPGFDPVAFAIQEAHRRGIAFHAYINPMPLRASRWPDAPQDPGHLFYRHGPNAPEPWVCVDEQGRPARSEYYYLSAGIPAVHAYVRAVIMDVVRRYDVDGIHLDRIRYPGRQYSHDPISRLRFAGRGNPGLLDWSDWQREQLSKLINDLAAEIRAERPDVVLSCAAWGIYNRYHIDGYAGFSSGYHDYFQDTWNWCRLGAMDVLMPMIYWNLAEPKPNYDELLADFVRGVGAKHFIGGQKVFSPAENEREIRLTRDAGAVGTVLWSFRSAQRRGVLEHLGAGLYRDEVPAPTVAQLRDSRGGSLLGKVLADDGSPLVDAAVSLEPIGDSPRNRAFARTWTSGADGRFAFLNVRPGEVRVAIDYDGAPKTRSDAISIAAGAVSHTEIVVPGSAQARADPFLTILRPEDGHRTTGDVVHVLGRTRPDQRVSVAGADVEVYSTGGFARDNVPLAPGENLIQVRASDSRRTTERTIRVIRVEAEPETPTASLRIVQPTGSLGLPPGEILQIQVAGPPGLSGHASLFDGDCELPLVETSAADGQPTGRYTAVLRLPQSTAGKRTNIRVALRDVSDAAPLRADSTAILEVWEPARVRIAETTADRTGITHGLHSVRLGGPWLAWVPAGTRLQVIARRGRNLQVRLCKSTTGWVAAARVRLLPDGTPPPHNYFTSCHVTGGEDHDTFAVAMNAPVAVAVRSEIEPNRLELDFFNTHDALTWNSHKSTSRIIGPVRTEQIEQDRLRVTVPLRSKQNWGYWTEITNGRLLLHVRRPPPVAPYPQSPLSGRTIALEAGHGGSNSGAVGHLGTKEKDVNLAAVSALQAVLEARGAQVVQVRRGDEAPSLRQRVERVNDANADFLVSLHANSAGSSRGFLRVSGTSTYHHQIHCRLPAALVYEKLLTLGWNEFGVVGDFSYTPLRNSRVPAILVEQAFMSHPGDEARLLDPDYHRQQAIAIADALAQFFERARG